MTYAPFLVPLSVWVTLHQAKELSTFHTSKPPHSLALRKQVTVSTPLHQSGELHLGPHRLDKYSNLQHVGPRLGNTLQKEASISRKSKLPWLLPEAEVELIKTSPARALLASASSVLHSKQLGKLRSGASVSRKKSRYQYNLYLFITVPCGDWPKVEAFCAVKKMLTLSWSCTA